MRLKHIKLVGFKSFVDATTVPFPEQMTAIVGPNGCGKSNVIDAVRWVLGESSAKNLRGDAMTDVIFNGSTNRKPVSQASVELVFSNTQGRISGSLADRSEISVKRTVTKDAVSTYFLNGSKCRRRDITDIFLGTGLGPRSYAIIEQGMISRLIESKPQELRVFLEEAAGISKYKERRRETETRIKHTRENLERLADVREELGTQLEKLKRQAATAKRYKELKKAERLFKAELTALKWHKYNEQLNFHEQERLKKETELESFVAEQRGGELGLITKKEQLQTLTDKIQLVQETIFQASNQITRIEQQVQFEQTQRSEREQQQVQLQQSIDQAKQQIEFEQASLNELEEQLELLEPENELLQEKVEQSAATLHEAEEAYEQHQQRVGHQHKELSNAQQACKLLDNKIQHSQVELARYTQHKQDLQSELHQINIDDVTAKLNKINGKVEALNNQLTTLKDHIGEQTMAAENSEHELQVRQQAHETVARKVTLLRTQLDQLKQWQADYEQQAYESNGSSDTSLETMLSQLSVQPQWQNAVEQLLSHHGQAMVVEQLPSSSLSSAGQFVTAQSPNTHQNSYRTVADVIEAGVYPAWLNQVAIAESVDAAQLLLNDIVHTHLMAVLLPSGQWIGHNWTGMGGPSAEPQQGVLKRLEQITELTSSLDLTESEMKSTEQQLKVAQQLNDNVKETLQASKQSLASVENEKHDLNVESRLLEQQVEHQQQQLIKLNLALSKSHEQIEMVSMSLEALEEERLIAQEQELELQSRNDSMENDKATHQAALSQARQSLDLATKELHQHSLKHQNLLNQQQNLAHNVNRAEKHVKDLQLQLSQIVEKINEASTDPTLLTEQLEIHLAEKLELEEAMLTLNTNAADIADSIKALEQGQSGVIRKLDGMKEQIADIKMNSEGARVRAQSMLDILIEMNLKIKDVLEAMPPEADETEWTARLDKTSNSIQRLGAINLAAIDEYDIQAERKGYLDEQFDDLNKALETLEAAIRKIDRESRNKFKETYDQVNDGLKSLFPKVFGGGAAYLELTDEDLLETGVTIMARPPGKKNSTIHLLSGGEKALTALSLVFSIFRLNPAPFCMLDEVDAPLDDANVGRFCKLVNEMSDTVQFIYISHNKVAMEMAAHLTGVTMQEPGVSRLVAVDIQQAVEMAEAN